MNLIDTYVSEVGRHLPQKTRGDIEAEIRSALQDLLDERSQASGKPIDDEMTFAVLDEYGDPEKVAASYEPERYLIGPKLYPAYVQVLEIILPICAVLSLLGLSISLGQVQLNAGKIFETFVKSLAEFLSTLISAVGSITLLFAILQWTLPDFKEKPRRWDAHSLLKVKKPEAIKTGSVVMDIFFTTLALLLFNFFPQMVLNVGYHANGSWWVGFISSTTDSAWNITMLSPAFFAYLPALNTLWVLTITLGVILLSMRSWRNWTRWFALALKVITIGLVAAMLAGPSLIAVTSESLMASGFPDPSAAKIIVNLMQQGIVIGLVATIIFTIVEAAKLIIRLTGKNLPLALEKFSQS
jgi:hypothetical protein